MEKIPYDIQQQFAEEMIRIARKCKPTVDRKQSKGFVESGFKFLFGQTITRTNISHAFKHLDGKPFESPLPPVAKKSGDDRRLFVHALVTKFPNLTFKSAQGKCKMYFGKAMRGDIFGVWKAEATLNPLNRELAEQIIARVQATPILQKTFGI